MSQLTAFFGGGRLLSFFEDALCLQVNPIEEIKTVN